MSPLNVYSGGQLEVDEKVFEGQAEHVSEKPLPD
jgi:hypothetical protein